MAHGYLVVEAGAGVRVCLRLDAHIMPSIQKFTENANYIHSLTNFQSIF